MKSKEFKQSLGGQGASPVRKEILVPVDFSTGSVKAVKHAVTLAGKHDAHLTLLNIIEEAAPFRTLNAVSQENRRRQKMETQMANSNT